MRYFLLTISFFVFVSVTNCKASLVLPPDHRQPAPALIGSSLASLSPWQIEKITGKHMNFIQRLEWKWYQKKLRKGGVNSEGMTEKQVKQSKMALIFGLGSLALIFIPYVALLAVPMAVVGLILGFKSLKGNSNAKGIIGIVASLLTILIFLLAVIVAIAFLSSWH